MRVTPLKQSALSTSVKAALAGAGAAVAVMAAGSAAAEVKIGGYVKADFIYDFDGKLGDTLNVPDIPLDVPGGDVEGEFRALARQTRFNLSSEHDDFSTFVEGDFFSTGNAFRLRHAYGRWGDWLAGQTWSTFMDRDFVAYFPTVDFAGPAGVGFRRHTMLRWTGGDFSIAAEAPGTSVADASGGTPVNSMPDLIARYQVAGDVLSWYVAGMVRRLEVEGGIAGGESETVASGHIGAALDTGVIGTLSASVIVNGGRYTYYGFDNPELVVTGPGAVEFVDSLGITAAWTVEWGNGAATTIGYGRTEFDDDDAIATGLGPDANELYQTVHANYRWSTGGVSHGLEAQWAERETFSGFDGDDVRLQYGVRFNI